MNYKKNNTDFDEKYDIYIERNTLTTYNCK